MGTVVERVAVEAVRMVATAVVEVRRRIRERRSDKGQTTGEAGEKGSGGGGGAGGFLSNGSDEGTERASPSRQLEWRQRECTGRHC